MQEVIDERADAIEEIYKGLVEVNKMFKDLSEIVNDNEVCCRMLLYCFLRIPVAYSILCTVASN